MVCGLPQHPKFLKFLPWLFRFIQYNDSMAHTLKQLLEEHPDWADLPIAVSDNWAELHYLDGDGLVYRGVDGEGDDVEDVLIFATD